MFFLSHVFNDGAHRRLNATTVKGLCCLMVMLQPPFAAGKDNLRMAMQLPELA
jgi:hypothetical protein